MKGTIKSFFGYIIFAFALLSPVVVAIGLKVARFLTNDVLIGLGIASAVGIIALGLLRGKKAVILLIVAIILVGIAVAVSKIPNLPSPSLATGIAYYGGLVVLLAIALISGALKKHHPIKYFKGLFGKGGNEDSEFGT